MKFGFVAKHRGAWPVLMMCETLGVSDLPGFFVPIVPGMMALLIRLPSSVQVIR